MPYRITPGAVILAPGEEVILKVGSWVKFIHASDDLFGGAYPAEVAIEEYFEVPDGFILLWMSLADKTEGAGKLTELPGGKASYKASDKEVPLITAFYIQAILHNQEKPLRALINIKDVELGVFIKIGTATYEISDAYAISSADEQAVIWKGGLNDFYGNISWKTPGTGPRPWSDETKFNWEPKVVGPRIFYQSYWDDGQQISAGNVTITKDGKAGELVKGTFTLSNAGMYKVNEGSGDLEYVEKKEINGWFTVLKK